jgi:hypothetical protein
MTINKMTQEERFLRDFDRLASRAEHFLCSSPKNTSSKSYKTNNRLGFHNNVVQMSDYLKGNRNGTKELRHECKET